MRRSVVAMVGVAVLALVGRCAAQDFAFTLKGADVAYAEHNYDVARQLYERAIREGASLDTDLPHARNLVTTYLNANPPETAKTIQWLQVVVKLDPQADGLRLQLCKLLMNTGDTGAAAVQYRQLVERHPQSAEYVLFLASALRQDGKSDAAIRLLKDTVDHYPNLNTVRLEYARSLNFVREFGEARRQFSKVLDYDPNDLIAQVGMAKSMSYDGDQEGALIEYDRILKAHPGLYDAMIGKAFALLWSGRMEEARELLQKGLARHPDDREVREALASLPKGSGSSQSAPPRSVTAPAAVEAPSAAMTQTAAVTLTMPPRSITAPRPKHAASAKNSTAAAQLEPTLPARETEPKHENEAEAADSSVTILYGALAVMIALFALVAMKLRSVQKARAFESRAAAHAAGVGDFVTGVLRTDRTTMLMAGRSRNLSDLFTPVNKRSAEPVVIEHREPKPEPAPQPIVEAPAAMCVEPSTFEMPICEPIDYVEPLAEVIPIAELLAAEPELIAEPITPSKPEPAMAKPLEIASVQTMHQRVNATEVMIVGGLASVVQLQLRWLATQVHNFKPLIERDWMAAAPKIGQIRPAVIILNSGSDDRWTSMRMFSWIAANHPELRRRVIAVTTADHYPAESDDLVICEPIDAREWQQKVFAAIEASKSDVDLATLHGTGRLSGLRGAVAQ